MKFKKGDEVMVTIGKDRGKKGKIEKIFPKKTTVLVAGVNLYKRHLKARGQNKPGGIIDISKPLSVGKIALVCPKCNQITRIGYQFDETSRSKSRICKKCKNLI